MAKTGVTRISISLPPNLLKLFDIVTGDIGYDRSKAIQQAMRDFISEYQWEYGSLTGAVGTITLIYDHDVQGLEAQLTNIQHQHIQVISSSTHVHLDQNHCLLVIVVNGLAEEIKELASKLRALRGVHQIKLTSLIVSGQPISNHSH